MAEGDPHHELELRTAARRLVRTPLVCAELDPEMHRLIRRHEAELDRWFTQRLGYRVHVDGDTARLFKTGYAPDGRPLRTATGRAFTASEHTLLALVLAATASGPAVISLRDLVAEVRSAATESGVRLVGDTAERRALVTALRWLIDHGIAIELHEHVDDFALDEHADAVLKMRPDRIALLMVPAVAGSETADELLERASRRSSTRTWMRTRLVEDPVIHRTDLTDDEWGELRRRLGEEARMLDEMFGMIIEARAEGVAAIDPDGSLTSTAFPTSGTIGHAALLVIERLAAEQAATFDDRRLVDLVGEFVDAHRKHWRADLVDRPERLARHVIDLLLDLRMLLVVGDRYELHPFAARFAAVERVATAAIETDPTLW
jgi:uncharacterized protein (TIGR02678 family)